MRDPNCREECHPSIHPFIHSWIHRWLWQAGRQGGMYRRVLIFGWLVAGEGWGRSGCYGAARE